jgi:hypothetical protein
MSDLTVIGYPDEQTAARAWDELVRLEKDCLADLQDAAIIRRDSNGGLHVTTPAHYAVAGGTVLRTWLTHGSGEQLMKVLPGADPATAAREGTRTPRRPEGRSCPGGCARAWSSPRTSSSSRRWPTSARSAMRSARPGGPDSRPPAWRRPPRTR